MVLIMVRMFVLRSNCGYNGIVEIAFEVRCYDNAMQMHGLLAGLG